MSQEQQPDLSMSHQAVKVKNAHLVCRCDLNIPNSWDLWHYSTKILTVRNKQVTDIKPCSDSSIRAINQALRFLGYTAKCSDIVKYRESLGETIVKSY